MSPSVFNLNHAFSRIIILLLVMFSCPTKYYLHVLTQQNWGKPSIINLMSFSNAAVYNLKSVYGLTCWFVSKVPWSGTVLLAKTDYISTFLQHPTFLLLPSAIHPETSGDSQSERLLSHSPRPVKWWWRSRGSSPISLYLSVFRAPPTSAANPTWSIPHYALAVVTLTLTDVLGQTV